MTQLERDNLCPWLNENVERFLDGELNPSETSIAEEHLATCTLCAQQVEFAGQISSTLRTLPIVDCPDSVTEAVYEKVAVSALKRSMQGFDWGRLFTPPVWRPALIGVVSVGLVALIAVIGGRRDVVPAYTARDLARARVEAKWALRLVNQVGERAGAQMRNELLNPRVIRPVIRAVETEAAKRGSKRDAQEVRNEG